MLPVTALIVSAIVIARKRRRGRNRDRNPFAWIDDIPSTTQSNTQQHSIGASGAEAGEAREGRDEMIIVFGTAVSLADPRPSFSGVRGGTLMAHGVTESETNTIPPTPTSTTFLNTTFDTSIPSSPPSLHPSRYAIPPQSHPVQSRGRKLLARLSFFAPPTKSLATLPPSDSALPVPSLDSMATTKSPQLEMEIQPFRFSVDREFRRINHRQSCPALIASTAVVPCPPVPASENPANEVGRGMTATPGSKYSIEFTDEDEDDFISRYMNSNDADSALDDLEKLEEGLYEEIRVDSTHESFLDHGGRRSHSDKPIILDSIPFSRRRSSSTSSSEGSAPKVELRLGWGRRRLEQRSEGASMGSGRGEAGNGISSVFSSDSSASIRSFRAKSSLSLSNPMTAIEES